MPAKNNRRRKPTTTSYLEAVPRESLIPHQVKVLLHKYHPYLRDEDPERFMNFAMWRCYRTPECLQITFGEEWFSKGKAMSFLRLARRAKCQLPNHLENLSDFMAAECPEDDAKKAAWALLKKEIENGNSLFFTQVAGLLDAAPEMPDVAAFEAKVHDYLISQRYLYPKSDHSKRGRNYLQRLILVVTDFLIIREQRLPTVTRIRECLNILMEDPPAKREVMNALRAIGLADVDPPVLLP